MGGLGGRGAQGLAAGAEEEVGEGGEAAQHVRLGLLAVGNTLVRGQPQVLQLLELAQLHPVGVPAQVTHTKPPQVGE